MRSLFHVLVPVVVMLTLMSRESNGQQQPLFSQYMFNGLVLNPAYAGSQESLSLIALTRKQWAGFDGSPSTMTLSAHTPLRNEKIALGFTFMNDQIALTSQNGFNGIFAYRIQTGEKSTLAFGLQSGIVQVTTDNQNLLLRHSKDPSFGMDQRTLLLLNFGTGIYYYTDVFYTGLSVPQIINQEGFQRRQYFYTAGYVFTVSPDVKLKPSTLIKIMSGVPAQVDLNANALFCEVLWFGVSYRSFSSLTFLTQIQVTDQLRIGYSYDNPVNRLKAVLNGSHEFVLTYNCTFFGSNIVSPRYF
ncbi:MAG: type IX secretion system membrane protein PorP/SprF [Cytophagaceae bacterium]